MCFHPQPHTPAAVTQLSVVLTAGGALESRKLKLNLAVLLTGFRVGSLHPVRYYTNNFVSTMSVVPPLRRRVFTYVRLADLLFGVPGKYTGVSHYNRKRVVTYTITVVLSSYDAG